MHVCGCLQAPKKAAAPVSTNPDYAGLSATQIEFMERKKADTAARSGSEARAAKDTSRPVAAARAQVAVPEKKSSFTPASPSSTGEESTKSMDLAVGVGAALLVGLYLITHPATPTP